MKFCKSTCRRLTVRTLTHLFLAVARLLNETLRGYGRSTVTINCLEYISIGVYIFAQQRTFGLP
jgi:hypothetical protein